MSLRVGASIRIVTKMSNALPRLALVALLALPTFARAQTTAATTQAASSQPTTDVAALGELNVRYLRASDEIGELAENVVLSRPDSGTRDELKALASRIELQAAEDARVIAGQPDLDILERMAASWTELADTVKWWDGEFVRLGATYDKYVGDLDAQERTWVRELDARRAAPSSGGTPPELLANLERVRALARAARDRAAGERTEVLGFQNVASELTEAVAKAQDRVAVARREALSRLFVRNAPPIWSASLREPGGAGILAAGQESVYAQLATVKGYARARPGRFVAHALLTVALVFAVRFARRVAAPAAAEDAKLRHALVAFETPLLTALLLSIFLSGWLYPQQPRLFEACLGALALVPTVFILRRLLDRPFYPLLNALIVFFFVDQLRLVAAGQPLVQRVLFSGEMVLGTAFLLWFVKSGNLNQVAAGQNERLVEVLRIVVRVAGVTFMAAFVLGSVGFVALGNLVGNGALGSAYTAVILYTALRVVDGLLMSALRTRPLSALRAVKRHRQLLYTRLTAALRLAALALWAVVTLNLFALRGPTFDALSAVLGAKLAVGNISLSLGQLARFGIAVWAAFLISRFLRFALEEDVYPRFHLARGLPYAISTMLHYAVLLLGFYAAVAAGGGDLGQFTILAGAFGVGLGFGLQNIFNNFISGIILLFERPVKVGDVVQLGDAAGIVTRIGIRASVVRTSVGSELIVPNGKFISDQVTNWTLSNRQREITLPVTVDGAADPKRVQTLLCEVATGHKDVEQTPPPQVVLTGMPGGTFAFELQAWIGCYEEWAKIRSELGLAVAQRLREEQIALK